MKSGRSLIIGLALFCASLLVTLVGVELLLRAGVFVPREIRPTAIRERPKSNIQSPDFRDPSFELKPKSEDFRILVVGDSFAWGDGVYHEDAFPHRLETRLNAASRGPRFEVINWSRPGWNTVRQYRSLVRQFAELDPDLVILAFVLNDPEPAERAALEQMLVRARGQLPAAGRSTWLFEHSRLYALVWGRFENSRTHRELSAFYRGLFSGEHWDACLKSLRRLRNLARKQGAPLILTIFPVFDSPMDERYPYADLHAQMREVGESYGIPVLDLLQSYEGMDARRLAVIPFRNAHPSEIAHRVAADEIFTYLARRGLVPAVRHQGRARLKTPGG